MSAASRFAAAGACIVDASAPSWPSLALNSGAVPGGLSFTLPAPVEAGSLLWQPSDGAWDAAPIGACLAAELGTAAS